MAQKPRNYEQEFRIKRLLAEEFGHTMASLARALNAPPGSVASNIYGYRENPNLRVRIAAFLGRPVEELFSPTLPAEETRPEAIEELPPPLGLVDRVKRIFGGKMDKPAEMTESTNKLAVNH